MVSVPASCGYLTPIYTHEQQSPTTGGADLDDEAQGPDPPRGRPPGVPRGEIVGVICMYGFGGWMDRWVGMRWVWDGMARASLSTNTHSLYHTPYPRTSSAPTASSRASRSWARRYAPCIHTYICASVCAGMCMNVDVCVCVDDTRERKAPVQPL